MVGRHWWNSQSATVIEKQSKWNTDGRQSKRHNSGKKEMVE